MDSRVSSGGISRDGRVSLSLHTKLWMRNEDTRRVTTARPAAQTGYTKRRMTEQNICSASGRYIWNVRKTVVSQGPYSLGPWFVITTPLFVNKGSHQPPKIGAYGTHRWSADKAPADRDYLTEERGKCPS